jgi:chitodextrinase/uncharacterized protein YkwD
MQYHSGSDPLQEGPPREATPGNGTASGENGIRRLDGHREAGTIRRARTAAAPPVAAPGLRWLLPWLAVGLLSAAFAAPLLAAPSAQEQAAIEQINLRRSQIGLPPLIHDSLLEQSARGHAAYLAATGETGHFQTSTGSASFTGATPAERILATGYSPLWSSNEVISFGSFTGVAAIEGLIQAIYHRFGIFSSSVEETGVGTTAQHPDFGTVFVVNSARRFQPPPAPGTWIGVYPYDGQTGVTRNFSSDTESPDPVPDKDLVGYPISIHVDDDKTLSVTSFTVRPVGGSVLPARLLTNATDAHTPASAAALIPEDPLAYGTQYEVSFTGKRNPGNVDVVRTWTFTTAPLLPITFNPSQPYLAHNSFVDVEILGGSGVFSPPGVAQIAFTPPQPVDFYFVGPTTLRFVSPAASTGAPVSGTITLHVTDNEGHTGQVNIVVQEVVDVSPDAFSFPPVTGAPPSTIVVSSPITVTGINAPAPIAVAGGEYSVNGGPFTGQPGSVTNGNSVRVRLTSSASDTTLKSATLTIGDVSAAFHVTTGGVDSQAPTVPLGLTATAVSATQINLAWSAATDNVGVVAYRVYREGVLRATVNAPALSFADTGLVSAATYNYRVAACDAAGNCSAQSALASATTPDNVPPSVPAGLAVTNLAATALTLNWNASTDNVGVAAYRVFRGGAFLATVNTPALSYSDAGLVSGAVYSYSVAACDAAGNCSTLSDALGVMTLDNVPPSPPSVLVAAAASSSHIHLSWNAATDNVGVAAYQVFRGGAFRATVNAPTTAFSDTGLAASTPYEYVVAACDAAGNCSAPSGPASASTLAPGHYAYAPQLQAGFNLAGNALDVTLDVAAVFGNLDTPVAGITEKVVSVWKWNAALQRWAFHSPQLTAAANASHAAARNYDVLATIYPGEGYWVNAIEAIALPLQSGPGYNWNGFNFPALPSGFNLIAQAEAMTPSEFNLAVSAAPPAPGVVPTDNFVTLWQWDPAAGTWFFYSPLLEAAGGLAAVKSHADSHFYLHFQDHDRRLGAGAGFWVNRP